MLKVHTISFMFFSIAIFKTLNSTKDNMKRILLFLGVYIITIGISAQEYFPKNNSIKESAQEYFPKNNSIKEKNENYTAFTNATINITPRQKAGDGTLEKVFR
jgi:hypothetical protein